MADQPREPVETPIPETVSATRPQSNRRMRAAIAVIAIASLAGLVYWRYRASAQAPPPVNAVQSKIPEDVVFADQDQLKNLTIEPVAARDFTIDREVTGKLSFNENHLTPVFPAYSGR